MSNRNNVIINNAVKYYGDFKALNGVTLTINEGELFTLLGPSGCGKTTLLRMIAGFNSVDGGEIYFDDKLINQVEAHKRDIGMVFQNYAIFPHMTVEENVAYGLKARKLSKDVINKKVINALDLVQISNLKDRKPSELSGGQQQRVALARAFVIEPKILLMDEPLSNLDAKLRVEMRMAIKKLQKNLGITTIYVTHDQEEALAISDRIAVMNQGNIMQVGKPEQIYMRPQNTFVASFIGVSNFIECEVQGNKENAKVKINEEYSFVLPIKKNYAGKALISVRPEQMLFSEQGISGEISYSTFLGDFISYEVILQNGKIVTINEYTKDVQKLKPNGLKVKISFKYNRSIC